MNLSQGHLMAMMPRPQGDGMDKEALLQHELTPPRDQNVPPGRHRNLQATPKATTIVKNKKAKFIPHEPVKGAVKAVISTNQNTHPISHHGSSLEKRTKASLNAPKHHMQNSQSMQTSNHLQQHTSHPHQQPCGQAVPVSNTSGHQVVQSTISVINKGQSPKGTNEVRTIQVPLYKAPSHLSRETYETIQRHQQLQQQDVKRATAGTSNHISTSTTKQSDTVLLMSPEPVSSNKGIQNRHTLPQDSLKKVPEMVTVQMDDVRSVEGKDQSDVDKLNNEIKSLKEELEVQTKVNTDLKKMLVASMGDDLQYKVESLVRTKAYLATEMGGFTEKIHQDYEDLDKLTIQADMWRSKYMASKVLIDELYAGRTALTNRCQQSQHALQWSLQESHQLKELLIQSYRCLRQLEEALGPSRLPKAVTSEPKDMTQLAASVLHLTDHVRVRLIGNIPLATSQWNISVTELMSSAEEMALQVLSDKPIPVLDKLPHVPSASNLEKFNRFHRYTRYDNLTFNCCRNCKGEIHVV